MTLQIQILVRSMIQLFLNGQFCPLSMEGLTLLYIIINFIIERRHTVLQQSPQARAAIFKFPTKRSPCLKKGGQRTRCIWVAVSTSSSSSFLSRLHAVAQLAKVKDINHNSALLNPISQATQTSKKTCPATALTANISQTIFLISIQILSQIISKIKLKASLVFRSVLSSIVSDVLYFILRS